MNTIKGQLRIIQAGLADWVTANKAAFEIAHDPYHLFALIRTGGNRARVIAMFRGEKKRGEHEEAGLMDRTFVLVVTKGKSLVLAGDATFAQEGDKPLYDLLDEARDIVRGLKFSTDQEVAEQTNDTEQYPDCQGIEPFAVPDGWLVDAYQIEFSIGTQLDAPN